MYVEDWEDSRQVQNELIIIKICDGYSETIEDFKVKIDTENIVHNDIEKFMQEQCDVRKKTHKYNP